MGLKSKSSCRVRMFSHENPVLSPSSAGVVAVGVGDEFFECVAVIDGVCEVVDVGGVSCAHPDKESIATTAIELNAMVRECLMRGKTRLYIREFYFVYLKISFEAPCLL